MLEYSIIAGNDDDLFRVDSRTGAITTKQVLDFERKQAYDLLVQVSDGFNVSNAMPEFIFLTFSLFSFILPTTATRRGIRPAAS